MPCYLDREAGGARSPESTFPPLPVPGLGMLGSPLSVLPPAGINKNIIPSPRSWLLYWSARQIFHNVGSSNWAPCQSPAPQVASELQSGGATGVGLEGSRSPHGRHYSGGWHRDGSCRFAQGWEEGTGLSISQPEAAQRRRG